MKSAMAEAADEVFEEARAHSDLANRIHESCMAARKQVGGQARGEWVYLLVEAQARAGGQVLGE